MTRRLTLGFLAVGSLLLCFLSLAAQPVSGWILAALAGLFPPALVVLALRDAERLRRLRLPLLLLPVLLAGALLGIVALHLTGDHPGWLGDVPIGLLLLLVGLWLLPFPLVVLAYALTFDPGFGPSSTDGGHR